jgi:rubrerythrin
MAEYIEREALLEDIEACVRITSRPDHPSAELRGANKVVSRIEAAPAADVVPVRHGRWIFEATDMSSIKQRWIIWKCSECSARRTAGWEFTSGGKKPKDNYCPNCGARMDGDGE